MTDTAAALRQVSRPIRRRVLAAATAATVAAASVLLALAAWAARAGWIGDPTWVIGAWAVALLGIAGAATLGLRWWRAASPAATAGVLEAGGEWRRGAVTSLLDAPAAGTSAGLRAAADRATAGELLARGGPALRASVVRWGRRARAAALVAVLGVGALAAARPGRAPVAALWHPGRAVHAVFASVRLGASATLVDRGAPVVLTVEARDRPSATLWLRAPGEPWHPVPLALDRTGRARYRLPSLDADLYARATSGGRASDTVAVRVRIPAFLGALSVTAHYPAYLHMDAEPLPVNGDTVIIPAGTRLVAEGEATAPLGTGAWEVPGRGRVPVRIANTRFSADFAPTASGTIRLALTASDGAPLAGGDAEMPIRVVADAPPTIDIPVPGADTVVGSDLRLPLVLEGRDDHGIASVVLETARAGERPVDVTVPIPSGAPDHVAVPWTLDLNGRGLLPGDTVELVARATDNAPERHVAASRTYRLRLVTIAEARAQARVATDALRSAFDSAAEASRSVARQTADLAQERTRVASSGEAGQQGLGYQAAQRAQAVADAQRELERQAEALRDAVRQVQRDARAAGLDDPGLEAQLAQIGQELDRALTPELRQRLAELQEAIKDLDPARTRAALQDLARQQDQLKAAIARSRELFRRAAVEGDLANLGAEARDLADRQETWNRTLAPGDSTRSRRAEQALADRADSLASALGRLAPQVAAEGRDTAIREASAQAQQAAGQMRAAARAAGKGANGAAREAGDSAAAAMRPVADALTQQRKELQQRWREDVTGQLDRALADVARLSADELALSEAFGAGTPLAGLRARQAAIEEGAGRVLASLQDAAGKNALISPQLTIVMAQAAADMERARDAISNATPDLREGADRSAQAVDGLNAAAYLLLRNRDDVSGSGSGSGLAEAMARMRELAGKQGALGEAGAGLLPLAGTGQLAVQLKALGGQERAIADALERLRAGGQVPGAGALAKEAQDLARGLDAGQLDRATVERQQRLFRRMLDAGRTLQGSDEDRDHPRVSQTAQGDSVHVPAAVDPRLLQVRQRMPSWSDLQHYSPEERRLVADYFQRLLGQGAP